MTESNCPPARKNGPDLCRSPRVFDSHCHLTDKRFEEDRLETFERALSCGLTGAVTIASNLKDALSAAELAGASEHLWCTAGIHPHEVSQATPLALEKISALASSNPGVVAIGETGLDFYYENSLKELQEKWFREHLKLSRDLDLPTVVHSRNAEDDTIRIIGEFQNSVDFVLHCFTGKVDFLNAGIDLGGYVSFSGLITFSNVEMDEVIRCVPEDRILVETDSPYLAPVPYRGKRNEPAYVQKIIEELARIRNQEWEDMVEITTANAKRFYGIEM
ncbi:MAG TPA: TatD family deoxyribonuclease [Gemmatimonadetes bacterium]|nr:TatD family deoxyribonuclease [Gemmatimonadota bacterium]